jgi:ferrochelatase
MPQSYDALLLVSFGGPEGPDDVLPFLENVLRGKNVPRQRMLEVAEHYYDLGGVSPINEQNRQLLRALRAELAAHGPDLPVYWGNRNWHPLLPDTLRQMRDDGIQRSLALATSAYSSYSGCRQYLEDIRQAREAVGPAAPHVDKLRVFFNHPRFIESVVDRVQDALGEIPSQRHATTHIVYTAHSLPTAMANGCQYTVQLTETCRLVSERLPEIGWDLVYQSRSGPPQQPWLEPDVCDYLRQLHAQGTVTDVVVVPVGFLSDHVEVVYDLDTEARQLCEQLGLNMTRAKTPGTHPQVIQMIRELILERTQDAPRRAWGSLGPSHDVCPPDCCPSGMTGRPRTGDNS